MPRGAARRRRAEVPASRLAGTSRYLPSGPCGWLAPRLPDRGRGLPALVLLLVLVSALAALVGVLVSALGRVAALVGVLVSALGRVAALGRVLISALALGGLVRALGAALLADPVLRVPDALVYLVAEPITGRLVGFVPELIQALVGKVRVFVCQILGFVLGLVEDAHGSPRYHSVNAELCRHVPFSSRPRPVLPALPAAVLLTRQRGGGYSRRCRRLIHARAVNGKTGGNLKAPAASFTAGLTVMPGPKVGAWGGTPLGHPAAMDLYGTHGPSRLAEAVCLRP